MAVNDSTIISPANPSPLVAAEERQASIRSIWQTVGEYGADLDNWRYLLQCTGREAIQPSIAPLWGRTRASAKASMTKEKYLEFEGEAYGNFLDAVELGVLIGYCMRATWPSTGVEGLDGWVARALSMAGLSTPEESKAIPQRLSTAHLVDVLCSVASPILEILEDPAFGALLDAGFKVRAKEASRG